MKLAACSIITVVGIVVAVVLVPAYADDITAWVKGVAPEIRERGKGDSQHLHNAWRLRRVYAEGTGNGRATRH